MASPSSSLSITGGKSFRKLISPKSFKTATTPSPNSSGTRRTSSGRYMTLSKDDQDLGGEVSSEFNPSYHVHIPPTPDNQPMSATPADQILAAKVEQQFVSNTIFSGGFNSVTRGHVLEKMVEADASHPQMACARSGVCSVEGCDGKSMRDERGEDITPCECAYRICRECYVDALESTGKCPGCKEAYKVIDPDGEVLPLPPPPGRVDRRLSLLRSSKPSLLMRTQTSDFDHARWLYETKGTYGYGNALWPKDEAYMESGDDGAPPKFNEKARKPMSRKTGVSAAILSPYRLLVIVRLAVLGLFLEWRVRHPNRDAMWLWGMSVVCEIWFAFSWVLDQLPKLCPVNRATDLNALKDRFETPSPENPRGRSDLPGIDVFVSTADPDKEPTLVTANTILSILAAEYPVEKLCCYLSDDGGALISFEGLAEAASFARFWVPFCRKHDIEPRNPETYFLLKGDPTKNKLRSDFVKDRRRVKREYDEFKVRINGLPDAIRRRSDAYNAHEEIRAKRYQIESGGDPSEPLNVPKATWMADGTHWPGTWTSSNKDHSRGDHAGIIQVMLAPPSSEPLMGSSDEDNLIDTSELDIRLPMLVYVSREKRPGYDHNKKAGAMNALVRTSAIMSNGAFILNLDCDHYIFNSLALREAMCFMMDRGGDRLCYVQFPQRFEGIDPNDRYANHNTVFFDVNMRALDGVQGPVYVGTGCVFRRIALYAFDPPRHKSRGCCGDRDSKKKSAKSDIEIASLNGGDDEDAEAQLVPKRFGNSISFLESIPVAEFQGRPLDAQGVKYGRPPGALTEPREPLDAATVAEAINAISCWYEDKTEWGHRVGWIYGSVTEDVVTGFRMHDRGWRSVYCVTKRDAFRGSAPINLTDRLHQVLRWATGSVEIFFSRNNALFASSRLKFLQRIAYLNVGIYPFTSIFLLVYCFLPALSLFTGQFIVQTLNVTFLVYLLTITVTLCLLAVLEIKWSGITLDEWWRNEQFWVIGGTSAHLAAVLQGLLKVIAGVDISFTLTSKAGGEGEDDAYADLYIVKWSALMIPPITIMMTNLIAIGVGVSRTIYSEIPQWSRLLGGVFFSAWVLFHLYPFAKGLMGRRGRTPTIVFIWSGLLAIVISLLWVSISPPSQAQGIGGGFQFP
ncbi:cellulose synthase-like D3-1, glycosyltransferase family 2 protein [Selaginella moellendorffii]|uniref:Cellulose synthase-like D3-1, glycosyltransferase family 2 protein n=1 Tax=Selaginella moellendorffii TaxID=88036 RepID=D8R581_SELML|nr:cellulose synthase-like protein D2 [Selaginella moellendorffii]EFJ32798.1 cellulose synthase-like D3-1, glycosyltransferase family 2 protein [Selaginella moellendorffii]|eukprot:XP_002966771.1 cellulose synthase-like protein D2 [Selaginella moellendorffii]